MSVVDEMTDLTINIIGVIVFILVFAYLWYITTDRYYYKHRFD